MNYRSKTTAMVLCLFLGLLGAHWFYLGRPKWGGLYLTLFLAPWPISIQSALLFGSWAPAVAGLCWLIVWGGAALLVVLALYDFFCLLSMAPSRFDLDYNR